MSDSNIFDGANVYAGNKAPDAIVWFESIRESINFGGIRWLTNSLNETTIMRQALLFTRFTGRVSKFNLEVISNSLNGACDFILQTVDITETIIKDEIIHTVPAATIGDFNSTDSQEAKFQGKDSFFTVKIDPSLASVGVINIKYGLLIEYDAGEVL